MPAAPDQVAPPKPAAQRAVRWSLVLISANLILLAIAPWGWMWTVATGPAAVIASIVALVNLRGAERARGLRVVLGIGIAASLWAMLAGMGSLLIKGPLDARAACLERAVTHTAERECAAQFEQDYRDYLEGWGVTLP